MKLDIVIVTYNSQKWLENCINSIIKQDSINLKDINLFFVDNISKDNTVKYLQKKKIECDNVIGSFNIIKSNKNLGFGRANNLGFKKGASEFVLFLNPDTELEKDAINELFIAISNSDKSFAIFELKQKPYEHPKLYDPITSETSWASGACLVIRRSVFDEIGGFDSKIFMYAEDVDLSWNVRAHGYKIKYVPKSAVNHYCYKEAGEVKPIQYWYGIINNLNLRMKYGTFRNIVRGHIEILRRLNQVGPFRSSRKGLLKVFIKNIINMPHFLTWRLKKQNKTVFKLFKPTFLGFDYENNRYGAFVESLKMKNNPLVSIIVRTCGRINLLRECLISISNQTYKNIEVVIIEDGKNISEDMIKNEFSNLNVVYKATIEKVGRCKAGNIGLSMATGEYLNFLDDDDLFYADHVETLVSYLDNKKDEYNVAYSLSYESRVNFKDTEKGREYVELEKVLVFEKPFSRITLLTRNAFPIQAVMFKKDIYLKYGGFDLSLDNLEDWELWTRYAMENRFLYVPKLTSIYKVPYKKEILNQRQRDLDSYYNVARKKILDRKITMSPEELLEEVKWV